MARRAALAALILPAVVLTAGAPSRADIGTQSVPVTVPAVVPPVGGPLLPQAALPPAPPSAPTPQPTIDPSFKVPPTILSQVFKVLLDRVYGGLLSFLDTSVQIGESLYVKIAAISFILAVIVMLTAGELSLHRFVGLMYWRILEMGIWLSLIKYTWKGPMGMPGWLSAIIVGLGQIGAQIAHIDAPDLTTAAFIDVLPGMIADMGVGLFSSIMSIVSFGQGGLFSLSVGMFTGQTIAAAAIWVVGFLSACWALLVCVAIALRFFWVVMKAIVLGTMSFIQGFAGSRRLSVLAGAFLNSTLVLGLETCLTIIIVGLPYHVVLGLIQLLGFGNNMTHPPLSGPPLTAQFGQDLLTVGALVILDIVLTIWGYAVFRVPQDLAELFAGRIAVSDREITQAFQSSPAFGARFAGDVQSVVQSGSREGFVGAMKSGVSAITAPFMRLGQLGAEGVMAGGGAESGGLEGAAQGAARGFAMGGPEGAVVGAIAGAVLGGSNERKRRDAEEGGTISGDEGGAAPQGASEFETAGVGAEGAGGGEQSAAASQAFESEGGRVSSAGAGTDAGSATKTRDVNIDDNVHDVQSDPIPPDSSGEAPDVSKRRRIQIDDDIVTRLNAAAAALQRGASAMEAAAASGGGAAQPSRTSSSNNILDQLQTDMSTGDMLMRRFIYSNSRQKPPPPPTPDHQGASMHIPVTIGQH